MAKEQLHSWIKVLVTAAALVFAGGAAHQLLKTTGQGVAENRTNIQANDRRIDGVEISQVAADKTSESIISSLSRIEAAQATSMAAQQTQAIDVATIKQKVEYLERKAQ